MRRAACTGTLLALLLVASCAGGSSGPRVVDGGSAPGPSVEHTAAPLATLTLALDVALTDLDQPLYVTGAGDGSGRLFIVEKGGRILTWRPSDRNPALFLDLTGAVSTGSEQGLLGVAFPPDYAATREFWVDYTDTDGNTVLASFRVSGETADRATERVWLRVAQPYANHNGGMIAFGPDGYLYVGLGDGGSAGDPHDNAQDPGVLLGKILRIAVKTGEPGDPATYSIPADNPFASRPGARGEIWALGLRNPWRFSFDRATGDLWIGDVGQDAWEEIDFQAAGSPGGANYGWRLMEGTHPYAQERAGAGTAGLTLPVVEYDHSAGQSVTGGYVYRGRAYPSLAGTYLYADFAAGTIWGLQRSAGDAVETRELLDTGALIASFGEDDDGELYVVDLGGTLFRVTVP